MAENSANVAKMARILAIVHIIVGTLLICFGIADRALAPSSKRYGLYGIWTGVWVSFACAYFHALHAIFDSKRMLMFKLTKSKSINFIGHKITI